MKKYKALLADADGTLLDFTSAEDNALRSTCRAMSIPTDDDTMQTYKRINAALWRQYERGEVTQEALRTLRFVKFLEAIGAPEDPHAMAERFVNTLAEQADEIEGAYALLREVSDRIPVVIVTNGISFVQRTRFERSRLGRYIKGLVVSGEMGFAKPDPRMIFKALELCGVEKHQALMLGDEPRSDIAAANAAGVDSCWFNRDGRENETEHLPTYMIRTVGEALAWL